MSGKEWSKRRNGQWLVMMELISKPTLLKQHGSWEVNLQFKNRKKRTSRDLTIYLGFYNCRRFENDYLDAPVERLKCFDKVLYIHKDSGRCTVCDCTTECPVKQRLIEYVGLTLNFVLRLKSMNIRIPLQQCIGTRLNDYFTDNFTTMDRDRENKLFLNKESLPHFVNLSNNVSKAIFRQEQIDLEDIFRKST